MAVITKSRVEEWKGKYESMNAFEIIKLLNRNLPGVIGRSGDRRTRIMSGEKVAMVQILYNKLVEEGKISGRKMKIDGKWGETRTGSAIKKLRELVGTTYSREEKRKLKNRNIEKTLDGRTVELLVRKLTPVSQRIPKKVSESKMGEVLKRVEDLAWRLERLNAQLDVMGGRTKIYSKEIEGDTILGGVVDLSGLGIETGKKIKALREKLEREGAGAIEGELSRLENEMSIEEDKIAGLDAVVTLDEIGVVGTKTDERKSKNKGGVGTYGGIDKIMRGLDNSHLTYLRKNLKRGMKAEKKSSKPNKKLIARMDLGLKNIENEITRRSRRTVDLDDSELFGG